MDKKSIIIAAVVAVALGLWFLVFSPMVNKKKAEDAEAQAVSAPVSTPAPSTAAPATAIGPVDEKAAAALDALNADIGPEEKRITLATDLLEFTFTNKGGILLSAKALNHLDKDKPVELVLGGDGGTYFFGHAFGDRTTLVTREPMRVTRPNSMTVEFSRAYDAPGPGGARIPYTFKKIFTFKPSEYMFEVKVVIENSVIAAPSLSNKGFAYTLFLGPQIGPKFEKISNYGDTRKYSTYANEKLKKRNVKPNSSLPIPERVRWASVTGKYFSLVAIPDATGYSATYVTLPVPGVDTVSELSLARPPVSSSVTEDTMRFYFGPNIASEMKRYNDSKKNAFGYADLSLEKSIAANPLLGWLEWLLKKAMEMFNALVHNWGVAIILVTILVKVVFFPLTLKSSIGMAKMTELQPKIAEIQAKYKDKPERLQQETMEFYKREGYNPLSGCLPMLIQLPLFFAMYQLFSTHFDLRNAMFIPGWIPDLSLPDSVYNFDTINLLVWKVNAIRLLPVIYVVSQLLYGKYTQTNQNPGQNKMQMQIMLYGLPIFFFFILYNAPAGLLVYWITSNVLTIVQQMITNRIIHNRKLKAQRS